MKYKFSLRRGKQKDKTPDAKFLTYELCIRTWIYIIPFYLYQSINFGGVVHPPPKSVAPPLGPPSFGGVVHTPPKSVALNVSFNLSVWKDTII
jgi:hypothetical protein